MRITFLSSALGAKLGGPAFSEVELVNELSKRHEVVVICPRDRAVIERPSDLPRVPVILFERSEAVSAWQGNNNALSKAISSSDLFHLNGHWRWENYFLARLCQRAQIPYLLHPRGMLVVGYKRHHLKKLFNQVLGYNIVRQAEAVIALSQFEIQSFANYRIDDERVFVVPNGVEMPAFPKATSATEPSYFLYLGRLNPRKNLEYLIRGYEEYRKKGGRCKLRFVGPAEAGYQSRLVKLTHSLGLEKDVSFEDGVYGEAKRLLLSGARATIYPAADEAFGRVPFEAIAAGSIPLVPEASGSAEYIRKFFAWGFYDLSRSSTLADSLALTDARIGNQDDQVREAQSWVRSNLSWEQVSANVERIYFRILAMRMGKAARSVSLTGSRFLSNDII